MDIRELKENDLVDLVNLYSHLHEDDEVSEETVLESVWQKICKDPNYYYIGGFNMGELVSSCNLTVIHNITRGCRPYGVIENVVTHNSHREKGYGSCVLKHALNIAWEKSCYKVMLLSGRKSEKVFNFYESVGFCSHTKQGFIAKP